MKYGIRAQLPAASADLAQRFHAAMLQRMHQVQQGAELALEDPLDAALAAMHRWAAGAPTGVQAALEKLRDDCACMADGYSFGYAAARAVRTIGVQPLLRELVAGVAASVPCRPGQACKRGGCKAGSCAIAGVPAAPAAGQQ